MKTIFSGEVYEVLPQANGIIFSYCKSELEDKEQVVVAYKMISFDNGSYTDVPKNIYLLSKFGNNHKAISMLLGNYITVKSLILKNGKVFLLEPNGNAKLLDLDTTPIWEGNLCYKTVPPSDIAIYKNTLWACYSKANVLLRFNLTTMREELRIGGNNSPFEGPRDLFVDGDNVMVSNAESQKLTQVNLNTYSVFDYEEFEEPVYQYVKVGEHRFVVLKSGLYLI